MAGSLAEQNAKAIHLEHPGVDNQVLLVNEEKNRLAHKRRVDENHIVEVVQRVSEMDNSAGAAEETDG